VSGALLEGKMARQRHTPEQIIAKLRQAEIELSKGKGVHEQTY
jgi:uncharacterized membrane protein YcaP (DUF421 family)